MENILRINSDIPHINPDIVFHIGTFPVANSTLMIVFLAVLIGFAAFVLRKKDALVPDALQNFAEGSYEAIFNLINQVTSNRLITAYIFPLIGSILIFVLLSNIEGLIPGINEITYNGVAVFRSPTSDFNTTFGVALAMILLIQLASIRDYGIGGYIGKFLQFKQVWQGFRSSIKEGGMAIIMFLIGLLDIVSEIAKVVSLSLRLFGNMYAGQVLATVILAGFCIWSTCIMDVA